MLSSPQFFPTSLTKLLKVAALCTILASALIALLWIADILPGARVAEVTLRTFASLGIIFVAAFAWKLVRGRVNVPDRRDQRVP